jgi:uncharacterized membrane protein
VATTGRIGRAAAQVGLGGFLGFAGSAHLSSLRREFQAQVPSWVPVDPDTVVVASGIVEIGLGAALLTMWRQPLRAWVGALTALFFIAIFPGNIAQFVEGRDGFGLDTDTKRAVRLLFQPVLVAWAIAATDARRTLRPADDDPAD